METGDSLISTVTIEQQWEGLCIGVHEAEMWDWSWDEVGSSMTRHRQTLFYRRLRRITQELHEGAKDLRRFSHW